MTQLLFKHTHIPINWQTGKNWQSAQMAEQKINNKWNTLTPRFHQTRATNYANFCVCIRLHLFFANERNECNEKTTTWTTRTIKERQFWKIPKNSLFFLAFLAFERDKQDVVVVTFVPQLFMWRCGRSFSYSRSKRLQRVVHRTPATVVVTRSLYLSLSRFVTLWS